MVNRDRYLRKLIKKQGNGMIKIIAGIRRCGKSVLLFDLFYQRLIDQGVPEENIVTLALDTDENTIMVHISHLREKLEANPKQPSYLITVRGLGYKLKGKA